jgi:hypothetical protein
MQIPGLAIEPAVELIAGLTISLIYSDVHERRGSARLLFVSRRSSAVRSLRITHMRGLYAFDELLFSRRMYMAKRYCDEGVQLPHVIS